MNNKRSFTLLEIMITVVIISVLAGLSVYFHNWQVERAKSVEALAGINAIRKAEEYTKLQEGTYVGAENTEQVNQVLSLDIVPKYYEYKIVNATEDDFIVIAQRIKSDLEKLAYLGTFPSDIEVIAMNKMGNKVSTSGGYSGSSVSSSGWGQSGGGSSGGSSTSQSSGVSSSGGSSSSGSSSGGSSSGGSSSGNSGGSSDSSGSSSSSGDSGSSSGSSGGSSDSSGSSSDSGDSGSSGDSSDSGGEADTGGVIQPTDDYDAEILALLNILTSTENGDYYYHLILENDVSVEYVALGASYLGLEIPSWWLDVTSCPDILPDCEANTIYLSSSLKESWSAEAIAAVLVHEAVHADYDHNVSERAEETASRLGVDIEDLSWYPDPVSGSDVLLDSQDQEYIAFRQEILLWREIKGAQANDELDYEQYLYEQDEDGGSYLKEAIAAVYTNPPYLPYSKT